MGEEAGDFQLVFTVLKGVLILIVAALCFASATGSLHNFSTGLPQATGGFSGFMLALIARSRSSIKSSVSSTPQLSRIRLSVRPIA